VRVCDNWHKEFTIHSEQQWLAKQHVLRNIQSQWLPYLVAFCGRILQCVKHNILTTTSTEYEERKKLFYSASAFTTTFCSHVTASSSTKSSRIRSSNYDMDRSQQCVSLFWLAVLQNLSIAKMVQHRPRWVIKVETRRLEDQIRNKQLVCHRRCLLEHIINWRQVWAESIRGWQMQRCGLRLWNTSHSGCVSTDCSSLSQATLRCKLDGGKLQGYHSPDRKKIPDF